MTMRFGQRVIGAAVLGLAIMPAGPGAQGHGDDSQLLTKLSARKHSLADGIRQGEKTNGPAISAKFEMKGDQLMLSVYTAGQGRDRDAEHNTLMELIGPATAATWSPDVEVFEDKAHIARSAMHLTLLQLSGQSLADIVAKAEQQQAGLAYSAIPSVQQGRPVVDVVVATQDGQSRHVVIDLR